MQDAPPNHTSSFTQCLRFAALRVPLTIALAALLVLLGRWVPFSGDSPHMADLAERGWVTMHSSLTSVIHMSVYRLAAPFGFDGWQALSLSSALAGAMALQVLFAMRRHPLFLIANVCAGSFLVFVGEVENYAWVNLFLLTACLHLRRYLEDGAPLWPAGAAYCLAAYAHMLALFYLPAFLWAMRRRRFSGYEFIVPFFAYLALHTLTILAFERDGIELSLTRLVPVGETHRGDQWFTFFSVEHLEMKLYFHFFAGIFGLPLAWPIVIALHRRIVSDYYRFLLICSLIGLAWTTLWHPDWNWKDWDLFSQPLIMLHLLAGNLAADAFNDAAAWLRRREQ